MRFAPTGHGSQVPKELEILSEETGVGFTNQWREQTRIPRQAHPERPFFIFRRRTIERLAEKSLELGLGHGGTVAGSLGLLHLF